AVALVDEVRRRGAELRPEAQRARDAVADLPELEQRAGRAPPEPGDEPGDAPRERRFLAPEGCLSRGGTPRALVRGARRLADERGDLDVVALGPERADDLGDVDALGAVGEGPMMIDDLHWTP